MANDVEWTETDLALIQNLDAEGAPLDAIARRVGRPAAEVNRFLPLLRLRAGPIAEPKEG